MSPLPSNDNIKDHSLATRLEEVLARISAAEQTHNRTPGSVTLVAVSKTHSAEAIRTLYAAGQRHFGESYLQEALRKQQELSDLDITWHFIGAMQSNKTRDIAQHFAWVHSVDRLKIAQRLNEQRPPHLPPLNICIQMNIGNEAQKAGIAVEQLPALLEQLRDLPRLRVRGLMALPPPSEELTEQRRYFNALALAFRSLQGQAHALDTLSMGMSGDLEAAIAEGATFVRIGTDLFGTRH